ncbi:hypothetical protein ONZ45_g13136 [Pleurotus djamor]|nr:hypothetical protein ONZ45_g13136 [Pleurotus djamor]
MGLPPSPVFTVKAAVGAGRGAFATQLIPAGTVIHVADDLATHVLLREYRGEVCWECFAYDRGKKLKIRDVVHGFAFCSRECEAGWGRRLDGVGLEGWANVEKLFKTKMKEDRDETADASQSRPTFSVIEGAWKDAEEKAASILRARFPSPTTTKKDRTILQRALVADPRSVDIIAFQLHTILTRYSTPLQWSAILDLAEESCPYISLRSLQSHVDSYLHLVAILPEVLLPLVTPETLRTIEAHEVHNSFGIRSLEDNGSEFFGYGVWPGASYFNHSCSPNVAKKRVGRTWVFHASRELPVGTELRISYLGGDEDTLTTEERRTLLKNAWGFECACERCR